MPNLSDQAVLDKVIQKAIEGGWDNFGHGKNYEFSKAYGVVTGIYYTDDDTALGLRTNDIIFNIEFAKALWGKDEVHHYDLVDLDDGGKTTIVNKPVWQYHLQQLAVSEDRIDYLRKWLEEQK